VSQSLSIRQPKEIERAVPKGAEQLKSSGEQMKTDRLARGEDLETYDNLVLYVRTHLHGFSVVVDELSGEVVIRTHLLSDVNGSLKPMAVQVSST
jgi:hypothetical protein